MRTRGERGIYGAAAGLAAIMLIEAFLLMAHVASGQAGEQLPQGEKAVPALSFISGGAAEFDSMATPYAAVHFVGSMATADVQKHVEQVKRRAAEDAGVMHFFVVSSDAQPACKEHEGDQVRLVRDNGAFAARFKVEATVHTIFILDRGAAELGRLPVPSDYGAVSEELRRATRASALHDYNLPKNSTLALDGYDPVTYFTSDRATKGSEKITSVFRGVTYHFSSEQTRHAFATDPERYLPTYGGWCASAMGDKGTKVGIDPKNFKVKGGRLFLFYRSFFADAKSDWNKHEKEWEPAADKNWRRLTGEDAIVPKGK